MNEQTKAAIKDFFLENIPMDEIIENYGMEVAQELGDYLTEAFAHLAVKYNI